jgi:uncharacterized protein YecE (DUF72 family)
MSRVTPVDPALRVGIGGWTFEPWRGSFYPAGLPHDQELRYASRQLRVIEVNGTYYSQQTPATFARWRDETPEGFVFTLKASRFATNRRVLAEAGDSVQRFIDSGLAELGPKLGPIVWQFAPTKRFDAGDFEAFLKLLPGSLKGRRLRHAIDVRHDSFRCAEYVALARRYGVCNVFTESPDYPAMADLTADFVYARVMRTEDAEPEGLAPAVLDGIAACARAWHRGSEPAGLPRIEPPPPPVAVQRDVFVFFIAGAKQRAPAAALALQRRLDGWACAT